MPVVAGCLVVNKLSLSRSNGLGTVVAASSGPLFRILQEKIHPGRFYISNQFLNFSKSVLCVYIFNFRRVHSNSIGD